MQSLGKRWRHVFLHHIFLDDYPLRFKIHTRIVASLFVLFSFIFPLISSLFFFFCYTLFIVLWLGCGLINLFTTPEVITALNSLTFEDSSS